MNSGVGVFAATTILGILSMFGLLGMTGMLGVRWMNRINSIPGVAALRRGCLWLARFWGRLWLQAHPVQALAEALTISIGCSLTVLAIPHTSSLDSLLRYLPFLVIVNGPGCLLWLSFRLRMRQDRWRRDLVSDALIGLLASFALAVIAITTAFTLAPSLPIYGYSLPQHLITVLTLPNVSNTLLGMLFGQYLIFLAPREGMRLWLFWLRLGRTRLRWSLASASLMSAALAAGIFITLLTILLLATTHAQVTILFIVLFLLFLTALGLVFLTPPSLAFWYLFARGITNRLQTLAASAEALRAGDYSVRTPVVGEDEIAQLQANFNAMAADLEHAMRELQAERDNVATLLRARRELVASASHELRTPVATLLGYLESARAHWDDSPDGAAPPTLRHDLEIMEHEAHHLRALIDDLFTLARAEVGRLEMRPTLTNIAEATQRIAETAAPLAWRTHRVEVVFYAPPSTSEAPLALVDESRFEQILRNLLQNSLRHTQPGGIVALSVDTMTERAITVQVSDTGEGISPDDLPHIWDRFYQSRQSTRVEGGAGLGLALVKELTETMGGSVEVESVLGQGSRFTIQLPRVYDEPASPILPAMPLPNSAARARIRQ